MKDSFVYILASRRNGTLYIGSTTNLIKRIWEHKNNIIADCFTAKYQIHQLVYYEVHQNILEAALREKQLKKWSRKWKLNIIEQCNPAWHDLYIEIGT